MIPDKRRLVQPRRNAGDDEDYEQVVLDPLEGDPPVREGLVGDTDDSEPREQTGELLKEGGKRVRVRRLQHVRKVCGINRELSCARE